MRPNVGQKIFNLLQRPLLLILLILGIIILFQQTKLFPPFKDWFKSKPLLIDDTPLVIEQVKQIAQLQTVQMYAEVIADSSILTQAGITNQALKSIGMMTLPFAEQKKLVLIIKGKVIAGIDLKKLGADQVYVKDDSVSIVLPLAEIWEVITNPSDIETFIEEGAWTDAEVRAVKNAARRHLLEEAASQHLLKQAADRAKLVIGQFLQSVGFKKINIM